tara:strand:+ start:192 stop:449 length:258 start_codon:yes stop_codon:yes gene_type:complete
MKKLKKEVKVTDHFVERYYQRILNKSISRENIKENKDNVINDIERRISKRDKDNLLFFKTIDSIKVPYNNNQIVMKSGTFITILN